MSIQGDHEEAEAIKRAAYINFHYAMDDENDSEDPIECNCCGWAGGLSKLTYYTQRSYDNTPDKETLLCLLCADSRAGNIVLYKSVEISNEDLMRQVNKVGNI